MRTVILAVAVVSVSSQAATLQLLKDFNKTHAIADVVHIGDANASSDYFLPHASQGPKWSARFVLAAPRPATLRIDHYNADNIGNQRAFISINGTFVGYLSFSGNLIKDLRGSMVLPVLSDKFVVPSTYFKAGDNVVVIESQGPPDYDDISFTNVRIDYECGPPLPFTRFPQYGGVGVPTHFGFITTDHPMGCKTVDYGCALTSVASMLSSFPSTGQSTPTDLDSAFKALPPVGSGYAKNSVTNSHCLLYFPKVSLAANMPSLQYFSGDVGSSGTLYDALVGSTLPVEEYLSSHVCNPDDRVILQLNETITEVASSNITTSTHFVYVAGRSSSGTDWDLFDPGWNPINVSDAQAPFLPPSGNIQTLNGHLAGFYTNGGQKRRTFTVGGVRTYRSGFDATGTSLSITASSPVELLVTNPAGQRLGRQAGTEYNEIVYASYGREFPIAAAEGNAPSIGDPSGQKIIHIPNAAPGTYDVKVIGTGTGSYSITVSTISATGRYQSTAISGLTSVGAVTSYALPLPLLDVPPTIALSQNQTPTITALTPVGAGGLMASKTFVFTDQNGADDLGILNILINSFLDGRMACYIAFEAKTGVLHLVSDLDASLQSISIPSSNTVSNSQCTINGGLTSMIKTGNTISLTINYTFKPSFSGDKVIYAAARDKIDANSGWHPIGFHRVPGVTSKPFVVSASPNALQGGTSAPVTIALQYQDGSDSGNLQPAQILINEALDGRAACYIGFDHQNNNLFLVNDKGDTMLAPGLKLNGAPGGPLFIENSQCRILAKGSSYVESGQIMTVTLQVHFHPRFAGRRLIYGGVQTKSDQNSGWQVIGAAAIE